jgi:hypothetical protein
MGKVGGTVLGVIGIFGALIGLIFTLLIGLTAVGYEPFSFLALLVFSLSALVSAIYSFKDKRWAKIGVIISFVVILAVLYNLFSLVINLLL